MQNSRQSRGAGLAGHAALDAAQDVVVQGEWKTAQQKRTWGGWWTAAEHQPACAQVAKKANVTLACKEIVWPAGQGH